MRSWCALIPSQKSLGSTVMTLCSLCGNLELKARAKLHLPEVPGGRAYGSEGVVSECSIGKRKTLMVGGIEHFSPDLQLHAFCDFELFGEGKIKVADPVSPQLGEVAWRLAGNVVTRIGKASVVQPWLPSARRVAVADTGRQLRTDDVRSLIAI